MSKDKYIREREESIDSCQDGVTGLLRRDVLEEKINSRFNERILEITKGKKEYSVVLFDIDYFKSINDLFSHSQGDLVLREIGDILKDFSSKNEFVGVGVSCIDLQKLSKRISTEKLKETIKKADTALDYAEYMGRNNVQTFSRFLEKEVQNLDLIRQFYFQNASKKPKELQKLFQEDFLKEYPEVIGKMKKHFYFIRTEINSKDTRTQSVFADRLYKTVENLGDKEFFLKNLRRYITS